MAGHQVEVLTTVPHYPGWRAFSGYKAWRYCKERLNGVLVRRTPMYLNPRAEGFVRMAMPFSWALTAAPVLLFRALTWRPNIIVCVQPTIMLAPFALAGGALSGARTVQHVQDLEIDAALAVGHASAGGRLIRLVHRIEGAVMRRFDLNVTISMRMRLRMLAKGIDPARIAIVRNWVDTNAISPLDRPSAYRAELGIADDRFVVQYSGQLGRKQALHLLVEAARLLADDPRFLFVIAGDGPLRATLEREAASMPNILLLPLQPTERLGEFLNLADCHILPQEAGVSDLVLPSKLGGMLASGKRMLITADAESELAAFLGTAATFTPPGDSGAIASALRTMIDAPDVDPAARAARAADLDAAKLLPAFERLLAAA